MANSGLIQNQAQAREIESGGKRTMQQYIKQMQNEIAKALPSVITPERFTRIVLSALSTNPKLADTTPQSFLGAMMTAAQLGVEPNTPLGQAYLIPFYNGKTKCLECQFQLGYKGLIDLAYRSGEVKIIQAHIVYSNDEFEYELGLEPVLKHTPAHSDRGVPTHVYAMFRTKDDGYGFAVMSMDEVREHAFRSLADEFRGNGKENRFEACFEICAVEFRVCPRCFMRRDGENHGFGGYVLSPEHLCRSRRGYRRSCRGRKL